MAELSQEEILAILDAKSILTNGEKTPEELWEELKKYKSINPNHLAEWFKNNPALLRQAIGEIDL